MKRIGVLIFRIGVMVAIMGLAVLGRARADASFWNIPAVRACCSEADAVYADDWRVLPDGSVSATVTGGGPRNHAWAPIGKVYIIPADKILKEPGNPTGRPLLFINASSLYLYCFAMGAGI